MRRKAQPLSNIISSDLGGTALEARMKLVFSEQLDQELTRQRVIQIVDEYVNSVDFMERVKRYAGWEIDSRIFTSTKFWVVTILSAVVTALIGWLSGKFLP